MPIYEYECSQCGHRLEAIQSLNDAPLSDCPECHEGALKRLVSAAAFRLKGGGWYETDFKNKGKGSGKGKAGSEEVRASGGASEQSGQSASTAGEAGGGKAGGASSSTTADSP
ncbi:FmdB family transcriptional regulator [Halorhodospira abdelmalekii]|uniref:FmdB family zinc ribbon protein n=1 Tax=Halorhodospira abdelmalekii TaxID=421629 RepID=UPI001906CDD8|nr:zinc ribbon domain-containing protein [Halorhodospira abdelmalekii]MBK1734713.1 FmdB family transcriptional regulator [Halorhodospira abdelmalekii]